MHVCLIPLRTEVRNPCANLQRLAERLQQLVPIQPDLVCLPECTLTGYLYEEQDFRRFAQPIPGPITEEMACLARSLSTYLCFGMLESAPQGVYNSAVLLDRTGSIVCVHRKNVEKPPFVNGQGVTGVDTELGRLAILICGDLFGDEVVAKLDSGLRLLLVPMSRSFDGPSPDSRRWEEEERQVYLDAVKRAGVPALIVNALETGASDTSFSGALVVGAGGELLAESPHGADQILVYDLDGN